MSKNIALYGSSDVTRKLLEECEEFNIIAIVDEDESNETVFGKKRISLNEVMSYGIDLVIVISKPRSMKVIYNRIKRYCYANQIMLYGINGLNLFDVYGHGIFFDSCSTYKIYKNEVINCIDECEAISFDVFDTLITRQVPKPTDLFDVIESRLIDSKYEIRWFKKNRLKAENECVGVEYSIHDIYIEYQKLTGISDSVRSFLLELEIQVELEFVRPRSEMIDLLHYCLEKDKIVTFISDMYLPHEIISKMLLNVGIPSDIKLYVSSEYGTGKSGALFDRYLTDVRVDKYLHIGDNPIADGNARMYGIETILIESPYKIFENSSYFPIAYRTESISDLIVLGLLISEVYNSPFVEMDKFGKPIIESFEKLGFCFWGPVTVRILEWINQQVPEYDRSRFECKSNFLMGLIKHTFFSKNIIETKHVKSASITLDFRYQNVLEYIGDDVNLYLYCDSNGENQRSYMQSKVLIQNPSTYVNGSYFSIISKMCELVLFTDEKKQSCLDIHELEEIRNGISRFVRLYMEKNDISKSMTSFAFSDRVLNLLEECYTNHDCEIYLNVDT